VTPTEPEVDERGGSLYEERTDLAWSRTGIALVGALALLARRAWEGGAEPADALVVALLGVAGVGWAAGILGWRFTHGGSGDARPRQPRELFAVAAGTVALAAAGLAFTFVDG
jgi:uncharacterized membrane protein YidH (DUF202 family)